MLARSVTSSRTLALASALLFSTAACSFNSTDDGGGAAPTDEGAGTADAGAGDDGGGSAEGGGQKDGGAGDGGTACATPATPGSSDPIAVLDDGTDFTPLTAVTDHEGRALAIGWANDDGFALPFLFVARTTTAGAFDATYGTNGTKGYTDLDLEDETNSLPGFLHAAVDAHDRLVVLFRRSVVANAKASYELEVVRLDASGHLDTSFADGGRLRLTKDPFETTMHDAALAVVGDDAFVFASVERFVSINALPEPALHGMHVTSSGALDPSYDFEGDAGMNQRALAVGFAGGVYVGNEGRLWKLTPQGKIDPTYGTTGYVAASLPTAVRADGTALFGSGSGIYQLAPSGVGGLKSFSTITGNVLQERCDGSVVAGNVSTSTGTLTASLVSTSGAPDKSRGTQGTVSRTVNKDDILFSGGVIASTIDPASATVTTFASKHAKVSSLVAMRVHP